MAAVDISALAIKVDATQPKEAARQLDALTKASDRTVDSISQLEVSSRSASQALREQAAAAAAVGRAELQTASGRSRQIAQLNQIIAKQKEVARGATRTAVPEPAQRREVVATGESAQQLELFNREAERTASVQAKVAGTTRTASAALKEETAAAREATTASQGKAAADAAEEQRLLGIINADRQRLRTLQEAAKAQAASTQASREHVDAVGQVSDVTLDAAVAQRVAAEDAADLDRALAVQAETLQDVAQQNQRLIAAYETGAIDAERYSEEQKKLTAREKQLTKATQDEQKALDALIRTYAPASAQLKKLAADEELLIKAQKEGTRSSIELANALDKIKVDRASIIAATAETNRLAGAIKTLRLTSAQGMRDVSTFFGALSRGDLSLAANQILQVTTRAGVLTKLFNPLTLGLVRSRPPRSRSGPPSFRASGRPPRSTSRCKPPATTRASPRPRSRRWSITRRRRAVSARGAREIATSLVASGRLGAEAIGLITDTAENLAIVTGKTAKEASKHLAGMLEDPLQAAIQLQKQYHLLTLEQFQYIQSLTDVTQGTVTETDKEKARIEILKALNTQMKDVDQNLGIVDRAFREAAKGASDFWEAIKAIGREKSTAERIKEISAALEGAKTGFVRLPGPTVQRLEAARTDLEAQKLKEDSLAEEKRLSALMADEQIAAQQRWTQRIAQARTAKEQLDFELQAIKSTALALGKSVTDVDVVEQLARAQKGSAPVEIARGLEQQIAQLKLVGKTTDVVAMSTAKLNAQAQLLAQGYGTTLTPRIKELIALLGPAQQQAALENARISLGGAGQGARAASRQRRARHAAEPRAGSRGR